MLMCEIFDPTNPNAKYWEWASGWASAQARFAVGNADYNVVIKEHKVGHFQYLYDDKELEQIEQQMGSMFKELPTTSIEFTCYHGKGTAKAWSEWRPTGTGNQFTVFSIIVDIVRDYVQKNPQCRIIQFSGETPSQQSLYLKLAQRIAKGWKVIQFKHFDNDMHIICWR